MTTLTIDSKTVQKLRQEIINAISAIRQKHIASEKITRSERTRWHQLLRRANDMLKQLSYHARQKLEGFCTELKTLLKNLDPKNGRKRDTRNHFAH